MVDQIVEFSHLLRSQGIRVSVAENMDAVRALECLDMGNLYRFKSALRCTLIKQPADFPLFDELFDRFFLGLGTYLTTVGKDEAADQGEVFSTFDESVLRELLEQIESLVVGFKEGLCVLAEALVTGNKERIRQLLEQAIREESDTPLDGGSGVGGRSHRIMTRLGLGQLLEELEALRARARRHGLNSVLLERLSNYLDRQIHDLIRAIHRAVRGQQPDVRPASVQKNRLEPLDEKSFAYYTQEDIQHMREIVTRLALRFKSLFSIRLHKQQRGRLDVKGTLRKNQQYGGVPFDIRLRRRKREKPQVMVLCDISDSVMNASRFMLQFVYSVQELYSKVRSFVFVSDLGEATQLFSTNPIHRAVDGALNGEVIDVFAHSDFGRSFKTFHDHYLPAVNKKTTVLILGDGRNNYHPANDWVLRAIQQRSKQLIWLNPESRLTWGIGDSEMLRYLPHCDLVEECRNIQQLARIVGRLAP